MPKNMLGRGTLGQGASLGLETKGDLEVDEPNGCTYVNGESITSSWDKPGPQPYFPTPKKTNVPSR